MKKFITIALVLLCCLGCKKEDGADDRLVGTTFRTDAYLNNLGTMTGDAYQLFKFETTSEGVSYWTDKNGRQTLPSSEITYTLDYPKLRITWENGAVRNYRFTSKTKFTQVEDSGPLDLTYYKLI